MQNLFSWSIEINSLVWQKFIQIKLILKIYRLISLLYLWEVQCFIYIYEQIILSSLVNIRDIAILITKLSSILLTYICFYFVTFIVYLNISTFINITTIIIMHNNNLYKISIFLIYLLRIFEKQKKIRKTSDIKLFERV